ncbi:MAG: exodeoxyribonuclease VII small subunit [Clostridia bacterium]|nr:exodeoxyribonuclease VII small subunit [Clostridia bacterium]
MGKKELTFEEAMKQLEVVAEELEKRDLNLDESVNKFEEGMKLAKQCKVSLEEAEKRITILLKDGDTVREENFIQEED